MRGGGKGVLRPAGPMKEVGFILNPKGRGQVHPSPSKLLAELSLKPRCPAFSFAHTLTTDSYVSPCLVQGGTEVWTRTKASPNDLFKVPP